MNDSRISGLDTARAIAIFFAINAHSLSRFGVIEVLPDNIALCLNVILRSATPTLIILYGAMLEIVYQSRIKEYKDTAYKKRLLMRSMQCYFGLILIALGTLIGGSTTLTGFMGALLFLWNAPYSSLLLFYMFSMIISIYIIELRNRSLSYLLLLPVIIWTLHPVIKLVPEMPFPFTYLGSALFGIGNEVGPSIIHGLSFILVGMLIGNYFVQRKHGNDSSRISGCIFFLFFGLIAVSALFMNSHGFINTMEGYADANAYRSANHPVYYLIGCLSGILVISAGFFICNIVGEEAARYINVFGVCSLFIYSFGNFLLNALPAGSYETDFALLFSCLFIIAMYLIGLIYSNAVIYSKTGGRRALFYNLIYRVHQTFTDSSSMISMRISGLLRSLLK